MLKIPSQMFSKPNMIYKQLNTVYCWTLKFQSQMISKQTRFLPLCPLWSSLSLVISFPILLSHPLMGVLPVTFALHYQLQWHLNPLPLPARSWPGSASTDTTSKAPAKTIEGSKAAKKTLEMVAVAAAADDSRKTQMHKDFCHMCLWTLRYHQQEGLHCMVCPTPPTQCTPPVYPQATPKSIGDAALAAHHRQHDVLHLCRL